MFPINQNPIAAASAKQQYLLDSALNRCSFRPESPRNVRSSLFMDSSLDIWTLNTVWLSWKPKERFPFENRL